MRARVARRALAFHLAVRAGAALRAVGFQLAVMSRGALLAIVFPLPVRTPLLSHHSRRRTPTRAHYSSLATTSEKSKEKSRGFRLPVSEKSKKFTQT